MENPERVFEQAGVFAADCVIGLLLLRAGHVDGAEPLIKESLERGICACRLVLNFIYLSQDEERKKSFKEYLIRENGTEEEINVEKVEEVLEGLSSAMGILTSQDPHSITITPHCIGALNPILPLQWKMVFQQETPETLWGGIGDLI